MSAQRQKPIDFAAEGLRLALFVDRNCGIRDKNRFKAGIPKNVEPHRVPGGYFRISLAKFRSRAMRINGVLVYSARATDYRSLFDCFTAAATDRRRTAF